MIKDLKALIHRQEFFPTPLLGMVFNPFYFSRNALNHAVKKNALELSGAMLDVGCGTKPYSAYFNVTKYIGMEVSASKGRLGDRVEVYYSGDIFPFENGIFDGVVSFQVLEHVRDPHFFMSEVHRVLKPGGKVLLTVPFAWEEHETPFDFTRYTSFGIASLAERVGFTVVKHEKLTTGFTAIVQLASGMIVVSKSAMPKWAKKLMQVALIFPFHLIATIVNPLIPQSDKIYLDNLVILQRGP